MKIDHNKIIKFILKLLVSLIFIAWLVLKINWKEVLGYVSQMSVVGIVLYIAIFLLGMVISLSP